MAAPNRRLVTLLIAASVAWPLLLAAAAWPHAEGRRATFAALGYLAAGRVCHQLPERSFRTAGVQWPVCGRCSGLYLAAPIGAMAASLMSARQWRGRSVAVLLAAVALPSTVTFVLEHFTDVAVGNLVRFLAAIPLGAAVAFVIVTAARGEGGQPIGYTQRP
ncbi:MAG TPA: DUF2085 domain-containing protein [Vicinamibacterales bacterium]|nr:DUF2085 domain-containing protein [Vicinamibacterales bacterium]